jgi:4-aminobutyrate aminotransferase
MISEQELALLSYPQMPKIVTNDLPGPKASQLIKDALKLQTPTRPSVRSTLVIEEGLGAGIKDPDGNIYIDMSAGVAVSSVGRNHPRVVAAVKAQANKLMHSAGLVSETTVALARKLSSVMPEGLRGECFTWFGMSGSAAIETAIKYARAITGRSQIAAFEGAYHGVFHGSLAMTTRESYRTPFGPLMPGVFHMPYAYCYRCFAGLRYPSCGVACGKYFDYKLSTPNTGADDVAAVIVEPMQADGGYVVPPLEFLRALRETCDKKGILLIVDEVQAGAGRTGKMWSIEHAQIVPDMLVWAKAVGGDMPLSGLTVHNRYYDKLPPSSQVVTAAENALANVVGLTNLEIITDPSAGLLERCGLIGEEAKRYLIEASKKSPIIGEVRGLGLFIGIELVSDKITRKPLSPTVMARILKRCEQRGARVMGCGRYGSTIRLMPPLVITREHLHAGSDILLDAIKESESEVAA